MENLEHFFWLFLKFAAVGGSGVVVDFSITYLLKEKANINRYIANSVGFITAATTNYFLNRWWTFQSENPQITKEYLSFFVIALIGLLINNLMLYIFHEKSKLNFYLAKLMAIGIVTLWNFLMNYFFTFS
ncbi:MAG: GtrA family protein [Bacteroidales bacterium]|nr:GtrA family protein [Bacteroidales bacterium]MCL2133199.1 GtrA family protein [Bacteroidales bacterium]